MKASFLINILLYISSYLSKSSIPWLFSNYQSSSYQDFPQSACATAPPRLHCFWHFKTLLHNKSLCSTSVNLLAWNPYLLRSLPSLAYLTRPQAWNVVPGYPAGSLTILLKAACVAAGITVRWTRHQRTPPQPVTGKENIRWLPVATKTPRGLSHPIASKYVK